MITKKERLLLSQLRNNSRSSLSKISKNTGIPISTLCETLQKLENKIISKHVSLMDFKEVGFGLKQLFVLNSSNKNSLKDFLLRQSCVNSVCSLTANHDFFVECLFKNLKEVSIFKEKLDFLDATIEEENFILEELKKEEFGL
ncbi:Lrp/AsnC family transcriptional regulator [Candidatus Woesearchaeota archaeon]|jgi:DNA-binding Lrp family transcriptional regulator|nr:Lrp/AsnC family transcriptional regulator [Candidatus Woesearchaeota archaeon]